MAQLNSRIIIRNDTTKKWSEADVNSDLKLLKGELGIEFNEDTGKVAIKIGDGATNWSALPYFLYSELLEKADKNSVYTKEQTQEYVSQSIAQAGLIKRKIVNQLPDAELGEDNTIYMVKKTNSENENGYEEYMLIEGKWELIGNTEVDLTGYITEEYLEQQGYVKAIFTAEGQLNEEGGKVTIPMATLDSEDSQSVAGLVKGSRDENGININSNGTMTVNSLNIDKITQTAGQNLILYGGSSEVSS